MLCRFWVQCSRSLRPRDRWDRHNNSVRVHTKQYCAIATLCFGLIFGLFFTHALWLNVINKGMSRLKESVVFRHLRVLRRTRCLSDLLLFNSTCRSRDISGTVSSWTVIPHTNIFKHLQHSDLPTIPSSVTYSIYAFDSLTLFKYFYDFHSGRN